MQEMIKIIIGIFVLFLGFFIGDILAMKTKEELFQGKRWFKTIVFLSLAGGVIGLIIGNDIIMFSFFFIAIVTSKSLKK
jgi:hypothetical protein